MDEATTQRLRRETHLHRQVKAILETANSIETPGLEVSASLPPPEELGLSEDETLHMIWGTGQRRLEIRSVRLEQRLGSIVPDVVAELGGPPIWTAGGTDTYIGTEFDEGTNDEFAKEWPRTVLIEVTVTHGIDAEKLRRIRELDLPTLEIDFRLLGGRVTLDGLRELVVNGQVGKRWVHHPVYPVKQHRLQQQLKEHPRTAWHLEQLFQLRRPSLLRTPADEWAARYLEAVTELHDHNVQARRAQNRHRGPGPRPRELDEGSEVGGRIMDAAEGLRAHGLDGAAERDVWGYAGIVPLILSIKFNRGVGYDVNSGYQVLNAIFTTANGSRCWDSLYAIAVSVYGLGAKLKPHQRDAVDAWRQKLKAQIRAQDRGEPHEKAYLRPGRHDALLCVLFPDMAPAISSGAGRAADEVELGA